MLGYLITNTVLFHLISQTDVLVKWHKDKSQNVVLWKDLDSFGASSPSIGARIRMWWSTEWWDGDILDFSTRDASDVDVSSGDDSEESEDEFDDDDIPLLASLKSNRPRRRTRLTSRIHCHVIKRTQCLQTTSCDYFEMKICQKMLLQTRRISKTT